MLENEPEPIVRKLVRVASILAAILLGFYAIIVGILYSEQRSMLFAGSGAPCPQWSPIPAGYRQVEIQTVDGLKLKALYRPALARRTTMLFFHGNADSAVTGVDLLAPLVADGRGALLVEFRGYCGNPGSPDEQGLYRDGEAASGWLGAQGVAPSQVVIVGYSLGTGVAAKIAADARPAALILISAYASMGQVASEHFPWAPAKLLIRDRFPTIDRIGKVDAPILIIHGAADVTVYPANAAALSHKRPDATMMMIPEEGHLVGFSEQTPIVLRDWVSEHRL